MNFFGPDALAAMNSRINTPTDPAASTGLMQRLNEAVTSPMATIGLGLLTNDGRFNPGIAQTAMLMQRHQDGMRLTKEEKERQKKAEEEAKKAARAQYRALLQASRLGPADRAIAAGAMGELTAQPGIDPAAQGMAGTLTPNLALPGLLGGAPPPPAAAPHQLTGHMFQGLAPQGAGPRGPAPQSVPLGGLLNPLGGPPRNFEGAPAEAGAPAGATEVDPRRAARMRMAQSLIFSGSAEQAAMGQKMLVDLQTEKRQTLKSEVDDRYRYVDDGSLVFPGLQSPQDTSGPTPFKGMKEDAFVRKVRALWRPIAAARDDLTQQHADRFAAMVTRADLDEMETTVLPDRTINRPGIGSGGVARRFLDSLGGQDAELGGVFGRGGSRGGGGASSGVTAKPLPAGESRMLATATHMNRINDRLERSMDDFDAASLWNVGGNAFQSFPTLQKLTTSGKWQVFNSNAKRWADMVLRLATGAQANKEEVLDFKDMFTPQPGESAISVANKGVLRVQEAIFRLSEGLTRDPVDDKDHSRIKAGYKLLAKLKTQALPRVEANFRRVEAGQKPFTRKEWSAKQKRREKFLKQYGGGQ